MNYLDHNATTPMLPEAMEAMLPWLTDHWGNPSSIHSSGRVARRAIFDARAKVATLIGALPEQVIFTSGATEANNAAIHSALLRDASKRHVITSVVEHSATLAYCNYLERYRGVEVTRLPVFEDGKHDPEILREAIRPDTALVSLMWANNETGVIWPVAEFAGICAEAKVSFHTDAVQAVGKIPVHFDESAASFLSLSGHKFGAPKGIGALIVADPSCFVPFIHGGKQEGGNRGGTENISHIVALGAAAALVGQRATDAWREAKKRRNDFEQLMLNIEGIEINGGGSPRLPNTSNLYLPGLDGDAAVTYLDQKGFCVSSGSACLESAITPSHVLLAMSGSYEKASESIRVSTGLETKSEQLKNLAETLRHFIEINA